MRLLREYYVKPYINIHRKSAIRSFRGIHVYCIKLFHSQLVQLRNLKCTKTILYQAIWRKFLFFLVFFFLSHFGFLVFLAFFSCLFVGHRYAFLGPLEVAHLNAEGMRNYCERYGNPRKQGSKGLETKLEFTRSDRS